MFSVISDIFINMINNLLLDEDEGKLIDLSSYRCLSSYFWAFRARFFSLRIARLPVVSACINELVVIFCNFSSCSVGSCDFFLLFFIYHPWLCPSSVAFVHHRDIFFNWILNANKNWGSSKSNYFIFKCDDCKLRKSWLKIKPHISSHGR